MLCDRILWLKNCLFLQCNEFCVLALIDMYVLLSFFIDSDSIVQFDIDGIVQLANMQL